MFTLMKKNCLFLISAVLMATFVCFSSCSNKTTQQTDDTTTEYTDDYGMTVRVPVSPTRVVSLSPAVTEIMFALGADSLLVGRTEFCVYPPEASRIENIGGISNLNIEKVLSCQPDLIISGSMVSQKVVKQFADMGVPLVCVIEKPHFDGLYGNITKIGGLVDRKECAENLNNALRTRMGTIMDGVDIDDAMRPTVYYVVGFGSGGNFTAGGNTFINEIIDMAGGYNIACDSEGWAYSLEALMESDPDFILIRAEDSARFCQTAPYNKLSAVKEHRMIALEDGILDLQVPRNIDVISLLRSRFAQLSEK